MDIMEERTQIKLKPCPFCGGENLFLQDNEDGEKMFQPESYWIQCGKIGCECEGPYHKTKEGAVEAWNERSMG